MADYIATHPYSNGMKSCVAPYNIMQLVYSRDIDIEPELTLCRHISDMRTIRRTYLILLPFVLEMTSEVGGRQREIPVEMMVVEHLPVERIREYL